MFDQCKFLHIDHQNSFVQIFNEQISFIQLSSIVHWNTIHKYKDLDSTIQTEILITAKVTSTCVQFDPTPKFCTLGNDQVP